MPLISSADRANVMLSRWLLNETETTMTKNATHVLDTFIGLKMKIDEKLAIIQSLSDDHFNISPDEVNWGHVGTLAHYAELLTRITDAAFKEGDHAE